MEFQEKNHYVWTLFVIELFLKTFEDDEALSTNNHPMRHLHGSQNSIPKIFNLKYFTIDQNEIKH